MQSYTQTHADSPSDMHTITPLTNVPSQLLYQKSFSVFPSTYIYREGCPRHRAQLVENPGNKFLVSGFSFLIFCLAFAGFESTSITKRWNMSITSTCTFYSIHTVFNWAIVHFTQVWFMNSVLVLTRGQTKKITMAEADFCILVGFPERVPGPDSFWRFPRRGRKWLPLPLWDHSRLFWCIGWNADDRVPFVPHRSSASLVQ